MADRLVSGSTVATILILDNDLGFSFWLGHTLTAPHCEALPARSVEEAARLIGHFNLKVDFLIVNPSLPGVSDFTRALRREQRHLRVATLDLPDASGSVSGNGLRAVSQPQ